jgi:hypothetical protein
MATAKKKYRVAVKGFPFYCRSPAEREAALQFVARDKARKASGANAAPAHGYGDPNAEYPFDRPEAFSATMAEEAFHRQFGGTADELFQSIYTSSGKQLHGKLLQGMVPADGFMVNDEGFVVVNDGA